MQIQLSNIQQLPEQLPALRQDIRIESGGIDFNRSPTWIIQDLSNQAFFHIGWKEYEILSRWRAIAPAVLLQELKENSLSEIDATDLLRLLVFLSNHCLIEQSFQAIKRIKDKKPEQGWLKWLVEHYLFFRLPLLQPDAFLTRTYPKVAWIFSSVCVTSVIVFALLGLLLLSYSWIDYVSTFFDLFNWQSLLLYGISLVIVKVFHELGHAYACKKYGLQVPTMGVAFLLMMPLLYTDTTESWRVKDPHKRIQIALAGVWVEFCLAVLALWLWMILSPGLLKSIMFFISSVSLATTILINVSPFLRFDGYHVLSDLMRMRNLQTRAFALTRWKIREWVFGWNEPAPEIFTARQSFILYLYSFAAWIYRLVVFLGIAFLVYHFFFKALGIILFIVEIFYFVLNPIYQELRIWWQLREKIHRNRHTNRSLIILGFFVAFFVLPWPSSVYLPATVAPYQKKYFLSDPAIIKEILVERGAAVRAGQILMRLESPQIEYSISVVRYEIERLEGQLKNVLTTNQERLAQKGVTVAELQRAKVRLEGLLDKQKGLTIIAPFDGKIVELAKGLKPGVMVRAKQALLVLINEQLWTVSAYIEGAEISLIDVGQKGRFIPEDPEQRTLPISIQRISGQSTQALASFDPDQSLTNYLETTVPESAYHASTLGGKIPVRKAEHETYVPEQSIYQVIAISDNQEALQVPQIQRGFVRIKVSHFWWLPQRISHVFITVLQEFNF